MTKFFKQTSNEPYDRHHYKIVCQNKSFVVESYDEVQEWWWNNNHLPKFDAVVHVLDNQEKTLKVFYEFYNF